jgi:hypothetical protein
MIPGVQYLEEVHRTRFFEMDTGISYLSVSHEENVVQLNFV